MLCFFVYGVHMATASFFQSIGKPTQSLVIPLVRQAVVLIPLALGLSWAFGFNGALLAAPVADVVSFLLSLLLVRREFRQWRGRGWLAAEGKPSGKTKESPSKPPCPAGSEYGGAWWFLRQHSLAGGRKRGCSGRKVVL